MLVARENKLCVKWPLIRIVWKWDVSVGYECDCPGFVSSLISSAEAEEGIPLKSRFCCCL